MSAAFREQCCLTCRHWQLVDPILDKAGAWVQPDDHDCGVLVVVTGHTWGSPYEKGDIVTREQAWNRDVPVEPLRTDWAFGCRAWGRETPVDPGWRPLERHPHEGACRCPWCLARMKGAA